MNKRTLNTRMADFFRWLAEKTPTGSRRRRLANRLYGWSFNRLNHPYRKAYWTEIVR